MVFHRNPVPPGVREASAADPSLKEPMRAYAFALLPAIDRFVVTSAPMSSE